jgi:hypothetical protein
LAFFLNLFTPETWEAFQAHGATVSGFRHRQRRIARERVHQGDTFLCYLVGLSRWCGVLEIISEVYEDDTPIFEDPDPFTWRFKVKPLVCLDVQRAIPIFEDAVWNHFSETKGVEKRAKGWAKAIFRSSLRQMDDTDGALLLKLLTEQGVRRTTYELTDRDKRQLARRRTVRTVGGEIRVSVPDADEDEDDGAPETPSETSGDVRQSLQVQAKLAKIGIEMGFSIWVPKADLEGVLGQLDQKDRGAFLSELPLNYDDTTLDTVAQIDVIWLNGRSIARAFEVEHTTAVYSGLLRMADLLALQPNMDIRLHIVAPEERRSKVFREMTRPVFSLLERGPLARRCTYLSYASVEELASLEHLRHLRDGILEEYEEEAEP